MFIIVLLFLPAAAAEQQNCSLLATCHFIWDNTTGNQSQLSLPSLSHPLEGIITLEGRNLGSQATVIHFIGSGSDEPLVLKATSDLKLYGILGQKESQPVTVTGSDQALINFQISTMTAHSDNFYGVYGSKYGKMTRFDYSSQWDMFSMKINETTRITTTHGGLHYFKYLSVCSEPDPVICPPEGGLPNPVLGEDYNITCVARGAPYIEILWEFASPVPISGSFSYNATEPVHTVTSTLTLHNFSLAAEGRAFICKARNHFGGSVKHEFIPTYTEEYHVSFLSNDTYTPNTTFTLEWFVTGWPIKVEGVPILNLLCNNKSQYTYTSRNETSISFYYDFDGSFTDDVIECLIRTDDGVDVKRSLVYRVGANCTTGEWGRGKECVVCKDGWTSEPGSVACHQATSNCTVGYYGVGTSCIECPENFTSHKGTVKSQECYRGTVECFPGYYYDSTSCVECPWGYDSNPGAAKKEDCFKPLINCTVNYYADGRKCEVCPKDFISRAEAAKLSDCNLAQSTCNFNYYGVNGSCTLCPDGTTGNLHGTVKIEDCQKDTMNCSAGTFHGIGSVCLTCPWGMTSHVGAAKLGDCFRMSTCGCNAGFYCSPACNESTCTCVKCPEGYTSRVGAAKLQDCSKMDSQCEAGQYGYGTNCTECPKGTTSPPKSKTVTACTRDHIQAEMPFLIAIGVALGFVGLLFAVTFLRFYLRRRRRNDMKMLFNSDGPGGSSVVFNKHFES